MTSKITLFDHYANKLIDFGNVPVTPRSYVLNKWGKAEFSVGFDFTRKQSDQLLQEKYFQYGNLIHIEHIPNKDENGVVKGKLPDWTGIILPPRLWPSGVCSMTAFSAEAILSFRAMRYIDNLTGTPAKMFTQILSEANSRVNNFVIHPGQIDDISMTLSDNLRLNGYDHILKIISKVNMDWNVTGEIHNNKLELFANLIQRKDESIPLRLDDNNSEPLDNLNTEMNSPLMTEQGTPSNIVYGYSEAQTNNQRHSTTAINQEALNDYGPLQLNQVYQGVTDARALSIAANMRASLRGRPMKQFERIALDVKDTFDHIRIGNFVRVKDNTVGFSPDGGYGFEGVARIISIDYNDMSNKAPLTLEILS